MFKWISNLQNKPEDHRRRMAIFLSIAFTLFIILIWIVNVFYGNNQSGESSTNLQEVESPIDSLKSSINSTVDSIGRLFEGSTEEF